ncbi:MAG: hypothetical protein IPM32_05485 [Ignavibacteriae bacterium]|nr:hypothetical protein [Ignavibacteriota bacterium]
MKFNFPTIFDYKMKHKLFLYIIAIIGIFSISCEDENEVIYETDAKLIWTGDYDTGGCGFFIEIDSILYKPENEGIIPPAFKIDRNLSVTIQYLDLVYEIETNCTIETYPQKANAIKLTSMDLNEELN